MTSPQRLSSCALALAIHPSPCQMLAAHLLARVGAPAADRARAEGWRPAERLCRRRQTFALFGLLFDLGSLLAFRRWGQSMSHLVRRAAPVRVRAKGRGSLRRRPDVARVESQRCRRRSSARTRRRST
jgi:hypothetical protein